MTSLRKQGLSVKVTPDGGEHVFSGRGSGVKVGRQLVRVFEYRTPKAMRARAAGVSPDGYEIRSAGSAMMVEWVSPPHFFKRGRVIVLFLGRHVRLLEAIRSVMGRQFAGS